MSKLKKILIVDDNEDFLLLLRHALETEGFEVIAANNAVEAGITLASELPDVILLDLRMPGINGLQACKAIKRNRVTKYIPIIIMSAFLNESSIAEAYESSVSGHFSKSSDLGELIKKIKKILNIS